MIPRPTSTTSLALYMMACKSFAALHQPFDSFSDVTFRYFKQPRANDFPAIAAVLRLSTKYFVEHLRQRCLERLLRDWPTTLEGWDQRELEATNDQGHYTPRDACPHPILVIDLALELGLSSILPAAFYDLSRYGPSKITAGTPAPAPLPAFPLTPAASQSAPPAPEIKILSTELLCLAFKGRERAQQFMAKFVLENVQHRPACAACLFRHDEQDPSRPCLESFYFIALNLLRSIGGIACGRDADPLFTLVQAAEMLSRMDFSDGRKDCGLRMCHPCKLDFAQECGRAKREVWDLLPAWFELEERGEGGDESFCA